MLYYFRVLSGNYYKEGDNVLLYYEQGEPKEHGWPEGRIGRVLHKPDKYQQLEHYRVFNRVGVGGANYN